MKRLAVLIVALLLCLVMPALAGAQLGPQNVPAPLTQPDEEPVAPAEEEGGLSTRQLVLIFGGAAGVLALIAWFIMRDARAAAPVARRGAVTSEPAVGPKAQKSARERERERARKRNRAKAVRNQRKRNRPR
ncbi:MAG: hypothetical protein WKF42_07125 [Solirubrobacteraceae bacterium]